MVSEVMLHFFNLCWSKMWSDVILKGVWDVPLVNELPCRYENCAKVICAAMISQLTNQVTHIFGFSFSNVSNVFWLL